MQHDWASWDDRAEARREEPGRGKAVVVAESKDNTQEEAEETGKERR